MAPMKFPLILSLLCLCNFTAKAQFEKFSGNYLGIATPAKWLCDERAVVDVFIYPDGAVEVHAYTYDLDFSAGTYGLAALLPNGRFVTTMDNGYVVSGKVSASGTVKMLAVSPHCKFTATVFRRTRAAYDPSL